MTPNKSPFEEKTDAELHELAASSDFRAVVEAMRRFRVSSDRWSKRLVVLTGILVVFTAALIVVAIETAYLAWVLLARGG